MKISTRGRYALRMLVDIALHQKDGAVVLKDVAERQNISKKYLEQIAPLLNRSGILKTSRGSKGGYMLAKNPEEITVLLVVEATEGSLAPVSCLEHQPSDCPRYESCATLYVWQGLYDGIKDYLGGITLRDIVDRIESGDEKMCNI